MPAVLSSAVRRLEYDAARSRLTVWFVEGDRYDYFAVPKAEYDRFLAADSKGRYFAEHIRDHYRFERRD